MIQLAINGALGKMGQALVQLSSKSTDFEIVSVLVRKESEALGTSCLPKLNYSQSIQGKPDVLLDFTQPKATLALLENCVAHQIKLVIGTTGFALDEMELLQSAAKKIPILFGSNMSLGANLLKKLVRLSTKALAFDYDIEIVEAHHRHKKDSPSGTAHSLAEIILTESQRTEKNLQFGRLGIQPRTKEEIGIHALRLGGVVGEHSIYFANELEEIQLKHTAFSRQAFAQGALVAAKFLYAQPPGFYSMEDIFSF